MDWKDFAGLAAITAFVGAVIVPAVLDPNPMLRPLGLIIGQFAVLTAFVFAFVAVMRFRR